MEPAPKGPNANAVKIIEEILEHAHAGDVTGVALIATMHDGSAQYNFAGRCNIPRMLGCAAVMNVQLAQIELEDDE